MKSHDIVHSNVSHDSHMESLLFGLQVESLLSKHDWIARDRQYFGQPNTAYDFGSNDPREVERKLAKLQEQKVHVHEKLLFTTESCLILKLIKVKQNTGITGMFTLECLYLLVSQLLNNEMI